MDLVRMRRRLRDAYLSQLEGVRMPVPDGAMVFPV